MILGSDIMNEIIKTYLYSNNYFLMVRYTGNEIDNNIISRELDNKYSRKIELSTFDILSLIEGISSNIKDLKITIVYNDDVVSILDGEVISIEDNAIYGKVVTIKHNDNLKSVYSNVKNVLVNVGYKISQGEIFASSDTYKVDTKVKSLLHFEVYYKDNAIDPENLYTMSVSDLK